MFFPLCEKYYEVRSNDYINCVAYCNIYFYFRRVQKLGLKRLYGKNQDVYQKVRQLTALPFLSYKDVPQAFARLKNNCPKELMELFNYFENNCVKESCLYNPKLWSINNLFIKKLPRTTNAAESYHRTVNSLIDKKHPGVLFLLDFLKAEATNTRQTKVLIDTGKEWAAPLKKEEIRKEKELREVFAKFETYELEDFLTNIASNL